ncbi:hypothetical protein HEB94_006726 [Actinopolymorpha pittospori]|uniref:Uncharacterized protein n=1 Tax=Actinopolymorpha pittospori TaxID=648752 RepID=A0A927N2Q7_9ACTN|nr:hypothetical protein [Actinopolymorpha pittospori]
MAGFGRGELGGVAALGVAALEGVEVEVAAAPQDDLAVDDGAFWGR